MLRFLWHYAHAIERRLFLAMELRRLQRMGRRVPSHLYGQIWRRPVLAEDWVNLLGFLDPARPCTLIDVGANVGDFTADFLSVFPDSQVWCMEPVSQTCQTLNRRFADNPKVRVVPCGASDRRGSAEIILAADHRFSTLIPYSQAGLTGRNFEMVDRETVQLDRIDALPIGADPGQLVLKIDVQGHEAVALQGAAGLLGRADLVLAEVSFANQHAAQAPSFSSITSLLAAYDLFPVIFQEPGYIQTSYGYERDVIFVRRASLDKVWYGSEGGLDIA